MAARKVRGLLECGALVTVVAPEVSEAMTELGPLTIERRRYERGEAANYRLVVTATGDAGVDEAVYADAEAAGVWVNSADDGQHCSFILPSVHRDGPVTFAVSTGGTSPERSGSGPAGRAAGPGPAMPARGRPEHRDRRLGRPARWPPPLAGAARARSRGARARRRGDRVAPFRLSLPPPRTTTVRTTPRRGRRGETAGRLPHGRVRRRATTPSYRTRPRPSTG